MSPPGVSDFQVAAQYIGGVSPEMDDVNVSLVHRPNHPLLWVDPLRHRAEDPRHFHPAREQGTRGAKSTPREVREKNEAQDIIREKERSASKSSGKQKHHQRIVSEG